jgi:hypothetical protein
MAIGGVNVGAGFVSPDHKPATTPRSMTDDWVEYYYLSTSHPGVRGRFETEIARRKGLGQWTDPTIQARQFATPGARTMGRESAAPALQVGTAAYEKEFGVESYKEGEQYKAATAAAAKANAELANDEGRLIQSAISGAASNPTAAVYAQYLAGQIEESGVRAAIRKHIADRLARLGISVGEGPATEAPGITVEGTPPWTTTVPGAEAGEDLLKRMVDAEIQRLRNTFSGFTPKRFQGGESTAAYEKRTTTAGAGLTTMIIDGRSEEVGTNFVENATKQFHAMDDQELTRRVEAGPGSMAPELRVVLISVAAERGIAVDSGELAQSKQALVTVSTVPRTDTTSIAPHAKPTEPGYVGYTGAVAPALGAPATAVPVGAQTPAGMTDAERQKQLNDARRTSEERRLAAEIDPFTGTPGLPGAPDPGAIIGPEGLLSRQQLIEEQDPRGLFLRGLQEATGRGLGEFIPVAQRAISRAFSRFGDVSPITNYFPQQERGASWRDYLKGPQPTAAGLQTSLGNILGDFANRPSDISPAFAKFSTTFGTPESAISAAAQPYLTKIAPRLRGAAQTGIFNMFGPQFAANPQQYQTPEQIFGVFKDFQSRGF